MVLLPSPDGSFNLPSADINDFFTITNTLHESQITCTAAVRVTIITWMDLSNYIKAEVPISSPNLP